MPRGASRRANLPPCGAARAGCAASVPDVLEVHDLTKRFGANVAVDGLSFKATPGQRARLPGPERRRQDHHAAHAARPHAAKLGHGHGGGAPLPRAGGPHRHRRRRARGTTVPSRSERAQPPAGDRHGCGTSPKPRGGGAAPGRARGRRRQARQDVLAGHAAAPQPRGRPARRSARPRTGRARERPRSSGDPLASRLPARAGRRRAHGARVEPCARRDGADGRRGGGDQPRKAGRAGLARRAHPRRRGTDLGAQPPRGASAPRPGSARGRGCQARRDRGRLAGGARRHARGSWHDRGRERHHGLRALPAAPIARGRVSGAHRAARRPGDDRQGGGRGSEAAHHAHVLGAGRLDVRADPPDRRSFALARRCAPLRRGRNTFAPEHRQPQRASHAGARRGGRRGGVQARDHRFHAPRDAQSAARRDRPDGRGRARWRRGGARGVSADRGGRASMAREHRRAGAGHERGARHPVRQRPLLRPRGGTGGGARRFLAKPSRGDRLPAVVHLRRRSGHLRAGRGLLPLLAERPDGLDERRDQRGLRGRPASVRGGRGGLGRLHRRACDGGRRSARRGATSRGSARRRCRRPRSGTPSEAVGRGRSSRSSRSGLPRCGSRAARCAIPTSRSSAPARRARS